MRRKTWRDSCRPIIAEVIKNNHSKTLKELKRLISKEYPFGERSRHPYKIWCDEVKRQLGLKKVKKRFVDPENQMELF